MCGWRNHPHHRHRKDRRGRLKYRNKFGLDIALEALRDTWHEKRMTSDEIWRYAKVCRVANVMHPYLDSLV